MSTKRIYNHVPDKHKPLPTHKWKPRLKLPINSITSVDLRPLCCPVYDQGDLGSCTANAVAFAYWFCEQFERENSPVQISRLWQYYFSRFLEGTTSSDSGAQISDAIRVPTIFGAVPETLWPYIISNYTLMPPNQLFGVATKHKSVQNLSVNQDVNSLKAALASGLPIVFGIMVYSSFESESTTATGIVPMPNTATEELLGGHCIAIVGYTPDYFIIRNSWGANVGAGGYYYMPYAYILDPQLSNSFWVVERVLDTN